MSDKSPGPLRLLGQQIRELRERRGLTLAALARKVGTSAPTLHRYENGWDRFGLATLRKIAAALDANLEVRLVAAAGSRGSPAKPSGKALVKKLAPLFWDRKLCESDLAGHAGWALERVLTAGSKEQVRAARAFFGDEAVRRAVERRGVDRRTRMYWRVVLGGAKVHPKVLDADGWAVARKLVRGGWAAGWVLAGGTGLALQLGHRVSEDLDFFRTETFDPEELASGLAVSGRVAVQSRSAGTLHVALDGMRVSFLLAQAPLLYPGTPYRGLVIADPRDIAVMKAIAIGGRGSRKDFVDLFFYLQGGGSLGAVFEMIRRRFRRIDHNEYHLLRSLTFFEDAETEPMPRMLRPVTWSEVKRTVVAEVRRLS